jgi:hypothetical protein
MTVFFQKYGEQRPHQTGADYCNFFGVIHGENFQPFRRLAMALFETNIINLVNN